MDALDRIFNNRLKTLYGKEPITGQVKYRVVRSELQTEKRYGSFSLIAQESGLWLGTKNGLVDIRKYWYFPPCWVLERVEPNLNRNRYIYELYTYEPILTFLDKDNNPLPLNWKAIEFAVWHIERAEKVIKTEADLEKEEEQRIKKEEEKVFAVLDAPDPVKELPTFKTSTLIGKK